MGKREKMEENREWVRKKNGVELVNGSERCGVIMVVYCHNRHTSSDSTPKNSFSYFQTKLGLHLTTYSLIKPFPVFLSFGAPLVQSLRLTT